MSDHEPSRAELESLFRRGALSRRQFVSGLAALGVSAATLSLLFGTESPPSDAAAETPQYVVLITLDAFRPDYEQLAPMPVLQSLKRQGISYDRAWVGQLESETPTSHTTLATGSMPKN